MPERVAEIGYINDDEQHALISIYEPALLLAETSNHQERRQVQVALSIDVARKLMINLEEFFEGHDAREAFK